MSGRALSGYSERDVAYLAVFGLDPGAWYAEWLCERIPDSTVEYRADHGHYPHLVGPERFVERLHAFCTWRYNTGLTRVVTPHTSA